MSTTACYATSMPGSPARGVSCNHAFRHLAACGCTPTIASSPALLARWLRPTTRTDSGGPGLYRGGCGVIRDVRVLCDAAELGNRMENSKFPPYGDAGGRTERPGKSRVNPVPPQEL